MTSNQIILPENGSISFTNVFKGTSVFALAKIIKQAGKKDVVFIASDSRELEDVYNSALFFFPDLEIHKFPPWDCLPYDRISPQSDILGERSKFFSAFAQQKGSKRPTRLILTSVNAVLKRLTPREYYVNSSINISVGTEHNIDDLIKILVESGYNYSDPVMEQGQYAKRGSLLDIFISGQDNPLRIDFFGDEVENIKRFDPLTQITNDSIDHFSIAPATEIFLDKNTIRNFRTNYRTTFDVSGEDDPLYEAISDGRNFMGSEHWLPLFYDHMDTVFDYIPNAIWVMSSHAKESFEMREETTSEYFFARDVLAKSNHKKKKKLHNMEVIYYPVPMESHYLSTAEIYKYRASELFINLLETSRPLDYSEHFDPNLERGESFVEVRANPKLDIYREFSERMKERMEKQQKSKSKSQSKSKKKILLALTSQGSLERISHLLKDRNIISTVIVKNKHELDNIQANHIAIAQLNIYTGGGNDEYTVVSEQDLLGDKVIRSSRRRLRAENYISEVTQLQAGDLVVHIEHGIGKFIGLETLKADGILHDCLNIAYMGGSNLFVPIENIETLSKYGRDQGKAILDKLGGTAWNARKARLKRRIRDIAEELIKVASLRETKKGVVIQPDLIEYEEFTNRFPYVETEEQNNAIKNVLKDLSSGKPMDRLVCGDVGFGKTEVALRGAFATALSGYQVALAVPTTLLARQHYENFTKRFSGFPLKIAQLSRFVTQTQAKKIKQDLTDGSIDIVIGTHALFAKSVSFSNLGLLIVDEEQHFGVTHKEHIKKMKNNVHVLTLTATPIPRTLQMALTGVRDMSLITTPPVDRLSVKTFVTPFDEIVIKEAIMRERYRGGQIFYICPHVKDLHSIAERLSKIVPDVKVGIAHGQLSSKELENTMTAFSDGLFEILLATNIIESGIDIPRANTIIIHKSQHFGLSQLHQMRGRVGRAKIQAYAYLTYPAQTKLNEITQRRLDVMQTLDALGAGFSVASHDLDIRGAGNMLGDEQHGNIREVGVELYQQMLEEAVANAKAGINDDEQDSALFTPQIQLGIPVLIPDSYINSLNSRMNLYRRLSNLEDENEFEAFAAELIDRFGGPLPQSVENLIQIMLLRKLCKKVNVSYLEVGEKGASLRFHNGVFHKPMKLFDYVQNKITTSIKDKNINFIKPSKNEQEKLTTAKYVINELLNLLED